MSSLGSTTSLAGLYPLIVRWSFGRSSHGQQTSHNCSRGSCPLSCWPQHSSNSRSSRKISSRFILCLWSSVVQVSYTNTSTKYKYCIQVPAPRPRTRDDPSFESQVGARHFPRTLRIAHACTSCKYHNLSGLLSQSTWGLLYDWRQSRFFTLHVAKCISAEPWPRTDFRFATGRTLPRRPHHCGGSLSLSSSQEPS